MSNYSTLSYDPELLVLKFLHTMTFLFDIGAAEQTALLMVSDWSRLLSQAHQNS